MTPRVTSDDVAVFRGWDLYFGSDNYNMYGFKVTIESTTATSSNDFR